MIIFWRAQNAYFTIPFGLKAFISEVGVSGIPTVLMFRSGRLIHIQDSEGKPHDRLVGVRPKKVFYEIVDYLDKIDVKEEE